MKTHGTIPSEFESKEDQNSVGEHGVPTPTITRLRAHIASLIRERGFTRRIIIVDGFLLFSDGMKEIRGLFDVRLFLRTSYATAKQRREARSGYVTLEGFWEDPPGYVDQVVWPNYVKDHAFLFEGGDVDGELDGRVCGELGIEGMPRVAEGEMGACLEWAVGVLERVVAREDTE